MTATITCECGSEVESDSSDSGAADYMAVCDDCNRGYVVTVSEYQVW